MKFLLLIFSLGIGGAVFGPKLEAYVRNAWSTGGHVGHSSGFAVPELDPSAAGGAMVLLLGGVAYFTSRRREESIN